MVAVLPGLPQWSHLGGGTDGGCVAGLPQWSHLGGGTGGGCVAGVTTVVTLRTAQAYIHYLSLLLSKEEGEVVDMWPGLPKW